jgi:hypothetical protein
MAEWRAEEIMTISRGLAAIRIRRDADFTYIHKDCNQELKPSPGLPNTDQLPIVWKCETCDEIVAEWLTEADQKRELEDWRRAAAPANLFGHTAEPRPHPEQHFEDVLAWMLDKPRSEVERAVEEVRERIKKQERRPGDEDWLSAYAQMQWPHETDGNE